MRRIFRIFLGSLALPLVPLVLAVDPIPESEQASAALKILESYQGTVVPDSSRKLHIVYFTPSDRNPESRYRERLTAILEDILMFYRDGMEKAGFGPKTFDIARDREDNPIIHLVKGKEPETAYPRLSFEQNQSGDFITRQKIQAEVRAVLHAAGISFEKETVLIFCNLAKWDEKTKSFSHHSPYAGDGTHISGWCFAVDTVILDLANLKKREPSLTDAEWGLESIGKFNTIFIGGIAHELGHAFSLPHSGQRQDEKSRGKSLMGLGNHSYREEERGEGPGAFLTMASALKLASHPLFSKSEKGISEAPEYQQSELVLSTNVTRRDLIGRQGVMRVHGRVRGNLPIYGIIAYFDCARDGGYQAATATSIPDAEGRFAIEISDLPPSPNAELRLEYCHVNGAVSRKQVAFQVTPEGVVDLERWELTKVLQSLIKVVRDENLEVARLELAKLDNSNNSALAKTIGKKLVATLEKEPKPLPSEIPSDTLRLPVGDARPQKAKVGWLNPAYNSFPTNNQVPSPFLDAGKIYATGLYAHAPSQYTYDLGAKWKSLRGEAGLHAAKPNGSVVFIIRADGKEVFRSATIRGLAKTRYDVDLTGVKTLELIVEGAGDGNVDDWALWLDPTLVS